MKNDLNRVRAALGRLERGRGRRFSPELRGMIVSAAAGLREQGHAWLSIGRALGLPPETPRRLWLAASMGHDRAGGFVPVTVSDDGAEQGARSGLVLVSPGGYRVEGLDAAEAADLLRRLQ
jgi:hypothetical protein